MEKFVGLRLVLLISSVCGVCTASYRILRSPSSTDLLPFLKAVPRFPTRIPQILPQLISNARVDYGVGLPGGRGRPYEGCSENKTLALWDFGVITSPKYPEDYPGNIQCEWLLIAPDASVIEATIYDIDIQPWFLAYYDSLSISRDGEFYRVDNYAGNQNDKTPFTVRSNGTMLGIRFKSNSILNYRGFKLAYIVKPASVDQDDGQYPPSSSDPMCGRATYIPPPPTTTAVPEETSTAASESSTVPAVVDETTVPASSSSSTELPPTTELPANATRIIGNNTAMAHQYPWMVAMVIDGKSFCGGSVIDEMHILTAAHCTDGAEQITLLLGAHNIKAPSAEEPERRVVNITKENIYTNPKYNEDRVMYDVSIIRLPEKLTFNDYIRPVCLPSRRQLAETFDKEMVITSGWGITGDRNKISPVLQHTNVTVLNNANCRQVFRDILTGNNICVKTTPTMSPCRGDSGGPLMLPNAMESGAMQMLQIGVVSFGTFTCERGYPVAYSRVTAFLDYISQVTGRQL